MTDTAARRTHLVDLVVLVVLLAVEGAVLGALMLAVVTGAAS